MIYYLSQSIKSKYSLTKIKVSQYDKFYDRKQNKEFDSKLDFSELVLCRSMRKTRILIKNIKI